MTTTVLWVERATRILVDTLHRARRHRSTISIVGLVLVTVLASGYVAASVFRNSPALSGITVHVMLADSGGLLANQDVTLRGVPIGRVESVSLDGDGVRAVARIHGHVRIPTDSEVRVSGLSAAGEQFLDFRPADEHGPYLTDGSVIGAGRAAVPVSLATLLQDAAGVSKQIDTDKLDAIMTELRVSSEGPEKLAAIFDAGTFLISTLDSVLPETVSILRSSRVVFTTFVDSNAGLSSTNANLRKIFEGIDAMDGGYRTLVDAGAAQLAEVDRLVDTNRATLVGLLGNLTTISQLFYLRLPALNALFPTDRDSVLDAMGTVFHDGGMWGTVSIYPRYACDYNLPRHPVARPDFVEPYLHTYCPNDDPSVLVRGARNAPRPPGDDTDRPPADYDPLATMDPTPELAHSIPTPYGGPDLPAVLPP